MRIVAPLLLVASCDLNTFDDLPEPRDCETRRAYYPDEDGDGVGEPTTVVFACRAPEGFVTELGSTGDTGTP